MDGKRGKEIRKYLLAFLVLVFLAAALSAVFAGRQEKVIRNQIAELAEDYPEMEGDMIRIMEKKDSGDFFAVEGSQRQKILDRLEETYGHSYVQSIADSPVWIFWRFFVCGAGAVFFLLWRVSGRKMEAFSRREEEQRIRLEESLREAESYIADLKEAYGEEEEKTKALITNISHQLKTPLASLRMCHELAAGDYLTEEEKRQFFSQEETEIAQLQALLEEMIQLSRLEKQMISLKTEKTSLRQMISEAVSVIWPKAQAKAVELQVEMEEEILAECDPRWTVEAFVNLLDNGVKYSPEHTEIRIRVKRLPQHVLIEFMDEGCGIPDSEKHKIYQRFYRGANSSGTEGAGVGLYLAREILMEEKGSIMVKNRHPRGSIFRVLLPL